jgi:hypothetical protein
MPRFSSRGGFDTLFGRWFVDDDAFERAGATLVEFQPARQRLDAHLEILDFDAETRRFQDEVVHHFVMELIERMTGGFAPRFAFGVHRVQPRLDVQRLDQRVRVEKQLQDRPQDLPHDAERRAM